MDHDTGLNDTPRSLEKMLKKSRMKAPGEFLHHLHIDKPDMDDVKMVIANFPDALLYRKDETIPIQKAAQRVDGLRYVPILAEEASRRKIGPERGGLFLPIGSIRHNVLQWMVIASCDNGGSNFYGEVCLKVLRDLRNAGLLLDQDFAEDNLIGNASNTVSFKRLDYLLEIYPESLSIAQPNGDFPIHPSNYFEQKDINVFERLLKAGMEHYPEKCGFLFKQNEIGESAIAQAFTRYGRNQTLQTIQKIIRPSEGFPILHHVLRYAPDLFDDFVYWYPDAVYLKDGRGRHLLHIAVKRGLKLSPALLMMMNTDKSSIEKKDPVTNLYPFMLAATSGYRKDLTTIYKLLSLHPDLIASCLDDDGIDQDTF